MSIICLKARAAKRSRATQPIAIAISYPCAPIPSASHSAMALPVLLLLLLGAFQQLHLGLSAVPHDLSDFQSEYVCDGATLIVWPHR